MTGFPRRLRRLRRVPRRWKLAAVAVAIAAVIVTVAVGALHAGANRPGAPSVAAGAAVPTQTAKTAPSIARSRGSELNSRFADAIRLQAAVPQIYPHVVEETGQDNHARYVKAGLLVLALAVAAGLLIRRFRVVTGRVACILLVFVTTTASLSAGVFGPRLPSTSPARSAISTRNASFVASCGPVRNKIACENSLPGSPTSEWDVSGAGDPTLQGYATQMSVNVGETVHFKIKSTAAPYRIDIYRLGYYQGSGARKIVSFAPQVRYPQPQPACLLDGPTGLIDCGNWAESGSWPVPATAVSGLYLARLVRLDTGGASQVPFVVRDDASHSDILLQTSDATWEAYNDYGGNSLYSCTVACPAGSPLTYKGAFKVSYNRPFHTRESNTLTWWTSAEYPLIRFLERNGYDLTYTTDVDTAMRGSLLQRHKVFAASGHDEYWSAEQRGNVEAARDSGVNLAFFTGNGLFWKTRWEPSIDPSRAANRTLVTYKETHFAAPVDPKDPPIWTGTWRDQRHSPPADGGRPENGLTGTIYVADPPATFALKVPAQYAKLRFWRDTPVAGTPPGQTVTLAPNTVGYEFDSDADNGFRPKGLIDLSGQTEMVQHRVVDSGSTVAAGPVTHHLTLYRTSRGALVFGAGTVQFSFGLDAIHDGPSGPTDPSMQQAVVNLFADMGAQPGQLMSGLTKATASTDTRAPSVTVNAPSGPAAAGRPFTVSGSASDSAGLVAGVEVSVDGGGTWHPATSGTASWSYTWTPTAAGTVSVEARATDDSGNTQNTPSRTRLVIGEQVCPCTILGPSIPAVPDSGDASAYELGIRFRPTITGTITGIRFYKSAANTGTHTGTLWSANGTEIVTGTFTGETAEGWQTLNFGSPVTVRANTIYVASYHTEGHYSIDPEGFTRRAVSAPPLFAPAAADDGGNGVFSPGASAFPTQTGTGSNYYVDVIFDSGTRAKAALWN